MDSLLFPLSLLVASSVVLFFSVRALCTEFGVQLTLPAPKFLLNILPFGNSLARQSQNSKAAAQVV